MKAWIILIGIYSSTCFTLPVFSQTMSQPIEAVSSHEVINPAIDMEGYLRVSQEAAK